MVCNHGLVNGLSRQDVFQVFSQYGLVERILMLPHKSYCFICFTTIQEAISAFENVNGKFNTLPEPLLFYLIYTNSGNYNKYLIGTYVIKSNIFEHFYCSSKISGNSIKIASRFKDI